MERHFRYTNVNHFVHKTIHFFDFVSSIGYLDSLQHDHIRVCRDNLDYKSLKRSFNHPTLTDITILKMTPLISCDV